MEITFEAGCRGVLVYIASEVSVQSRRLACMTKPQRNQATSVSPTVYILYIIRKAMVRRVYISCLCSGQYTSLSCDILDLGMCLIM